MSINSGRVLLLRGSDEYDANKDIYVNEFNKIHLQAIVIPVLGFKLTGLNELRESLLAAKSYSSLAFTSKRAVDAVAHCLCDLPQEKLKEFMDLWQEKFVFVVGESTGNAVKELLHLTYTGQEAGNAECLVQRICQCLKPCNLPILFPCGNIHLETLPERLKESGFVVESLVVYETSRHPLFEESLKKLLANMGMAEIVVFFSPSGVRYTLPVFESLKISLQDLKLVAIGPSTKEALLSAGHTVWCTSSKPTASALADSIRIMFNQESE